MGCCCFCSYLGCLSWQQASVRVIASLANTQRSLGGAGFKVAETARRKSSKEHVQAQHNFLIHRGLYMDERLSTSRSASCKRCDAGKFSATSKSSQCQLCARGEFSTEARSSCNGKAANPTIQHLKAMPSLPSDYRLPCWNLC